MLPGDGAFGATMDEIAAARLLAPLLREAAGAGTPLLGICIGMQVLFEESEEHGRHRGLGLLPGRVRAARDRRCPCRTWAGTGCASAAPHPLLDGLADGAHVYFVHSYFCDAAPDVVLATTDYGGELRGHRGPRATCSACSSIPRRARRGPARSIAQLRADVAACRSRRGRSRA